MNLALASVFVKILWTLSLNNVRSRKPVQPCRCPPLVHTPKLHFLLVYYDVTMLSYISTSFRWHMQTKNVCVENVCVSPENGSVWNVNHTVLHACALLRRTLKLHVSLFIRTRLQCYHVENITSLMHNCAANPYFISLVKRNFDSRY